MNETTVPSLEETTVRMKREILRDILSGRLPPDVRSFACLHNFVDANEYGGLCTKKVTETLIASFGGRDEDGNIPDGMMTYINDAQDAINEWLVKRGCNLTEERPAKTAVITNGALATILTNLLTNENSGEIDSVEGFEQFVMDIATVVADYCGGEVHAATPATPTDEFATMYAIEIENIPEGSAAWHHVSNGGTPPATAVVNRLINTFGEAIENDEEIDGGDAVEQIVEIYHMARNAAGPVSTAAANRGTSSIDDLPAVVIEINGGAIHGARSTIPMRIILLDEDVEGSDGDRIMEVNSEEVYVHDYHLVIPAEPGQDGIDPVFVSDIIEQVGAEQDRLDRMRNERNARRSIFTEAMEAKFISTSVSPMEEIRIRRDLVAQEVLGCYPQDTVISREHYDADDRFGECLIWMNSLFELPSWEGRTVGDFLLKHGIPDEPAGLNVIQHNSHQTNKDGVKAGNITLQDLRDARALGENGWVFPSGLEVWFHAVRIPNTSGAAN